MATITRATAYANNEVAYLAWAIDQGSIPRCLGFHIVREYLDAGDDKILVLDPLDPVHCLVALGSHNLGYKASYSNDENLVIVRGHGALAQAYAVHVLDVYDHYRFRAVEAELSAKKKKTTGAATETRWDGFLDTTGGWQEKASRRLANYFA